MKNQTRSILYLFLDEVQQKTENKRTWLAMAVIKTWIPEFAHSNVDKGRDFWFGESVYVWMYKAIFLPPTFLSRCFPSMSFLFCYENSGKIACDLEDLILFRYLIWSKFSIRKRKVARVLFRFAYALHVANHLNSIASVYIPFSFSTKIFTFFFFGRI